MNTRARRRSRRRSRARRTRRPETGRPGRRGGGPVAAGEEPLRGAAVSRRGSLTLRSAFGGDGAGPLGRRKQIGSRAGQPTERATARRTRFSMNSSVAEPVRHGIEAVFRQGAASRRAASGSARGGRRARSTASRHRPSTRAEPAGSRKHRRKRVDSRGWRPAARCGRVSCQIAGWPPGARARRQVLPKSFEDLIELGGRAARAVE